MSTTFEIVPFHDHRILTVERDGEIFVAMRPIVESLGLDWSAQFRRIQRHPLLAEGIAIMATPSGGGTQETVTITLEAFHGWLVSVSPDRIKDDAARALVNRYQREAFRAIFEHFHGPMRIAAGKPATVSEYLRVGNALKKERNLVIRAGLWTRLDQITDSWGIARLPHEGVGWADPDHSELLSIFWNAVRAIETAGHIVNHSRRNHLIAINLPEIRQGFNALGCGVEIDSTLTHALRQSKDPAYVADKTVNCRDGTRRHCWIFSAYGTDRDQPLLPLEVEDA